MNPQKLKTVFEYLRNSNNIEESEFIEKMRSLDIDEQFINSIRPELRNFGILPKQSFPNPSPKINNEPSLVIYSVLIFSALGLILFTFISDKPDWPSLFLNLATEIIGAVILLIVIDRNYKKEEIKEIRDKTGNVIIKTRSLFANLKAYRFYYSKELRALIRYCKSLGKGIYKISPTKYVSRPFEEEECFRGLKKGLYLYGESGYGKSTILQIAVLRQINEFIKNPKQEIVPILIPAWSLFKDEVLNGILEEINRFQKISKPNFIKLLKLGKVSLVFDGLDEVPDQEKIHTEIVNLHKQYNEFPMVISSRKKLRFPVYDSKLILKEFSNEQYVEYIKRRINYK